MPHPHRKPILLACRGLDPVGTGRQVEVVAAGLRDAGFDVHAAMTTAGGSLPGRLAAAGCTVHAVGRRPVVDAAVAAGLVALASRLRPGVIIAWGRGQVWPVAAARLVVPGVRAVGWLARPAAGRALAAGLGRLDRVIAATPGAAESCRRLGVAGHRIEAIPPAAAPAAGSGLSREEIARRLGLDPARVWTLCVAPLEAESRLERLLWAIDQLGVVRRDLGHLLVGAGPLLGRVGRRARVQDLAERLAVVPHCDLLPDLLGEVRLVWQPGTVALGGAILDGLARGVPAVAIAGDEARQLVADGETGAVAPAAPESEFPRRAFAILEDAGLAARLGAAAAVRMAERFPEAASVAAHVALCERLAG
jgi:glycosyltransferase involved in cell wall biosynthesis